jgi:hypothetical protein
MVQICALGISPILFVNCFPEEGGKKKEKKRKSLWRQKYIVDIFLFSFLLFCGELSSLKFPAYNYYHLTIGEDFLSVCVKGFSVQ